MNIPITQKAKQQLHNNQVVRTQVAASSEHPVIEKDLEPGIIAEANKDGTIYLDKSIPQNSETGKKAIAHEKVHLDQIERGDLWYDDECVYWKGKKYSRAKKIFFDCVSYQQSSIAPDIKRLVF